MSEHEKCAGCGADGELISNEESDWMPFVGCSRDSACWAGPAKKTQKSAWAEWDRVMRAAREAESLRYLLEIYVHAHRTGNSVPPLIESATHDLGIVERPSPYEYDTTTGGPR